MSQYSKLKEKGLHELCISFEISKKKRQYPIHGMIKNFGILKNQGLLFFHAFSGCDNVSCFRGIGKKSFYQIQNVFPNATETFIKLSTFPVIVEEKHLIVLESFIVDVYLNDKSATNLNINETRKKLLSQKNTLYDMLQQVKH